MNITYSCKTHERHPLGSNQNAARSFRTKSANIRPEARNPQTWGLKTGGLVATRLWRVGLTHRHELLWFYRKRLGNGR